MVQLPVSGLSEKELETIEEAADRAGMKRAEFVRTRLRAGMRMWDLADGSFDTHEFRQRIEEDIPESPPTDSGSGPDPAPAEASKHDRFTQSIKSNLPREGVGEAISKDELVEIVAKDVIGDVLTELKESGEVDYDVEEEGFVRVV